MTEAHLLSAVFGPRYTSTLGNCLSSLILLPNPHHWRIGLRISYSSKWCGYYNQLGPGDGIFGYIGHTTYPEFALIWIIFSEEIYLRQPK